MKHLVYKMYECGILYLLICVMRILIRNVATKQKLAMFLFKQSYLNLYSFINQIQFVLTS